MLKIKNWKKLNLLFSSAILIATLVLTGCSNDEQPQQKNEAAKPAPKLTFEDRSLEVDASTIDGSYYETLSSNPSRYNCTVRILNKTSHSIKQIELADCGSPPQTLLSATRLYYSTADVSLDPCLQPGEQRKISYEIKFDDDNGGGHVPSKGGPLVNSFTDINGDKFHNSLNTN